jgi:hypothetical protein
MNTTMTRIGLLLVLATSCFAAQLTNIGACTDPAVSDAVKKTLAPDGYHVAFDDGSSADVWFRAQVPTAGNPPKDASGQIYALPEAVLVGVLKFDKQTKDYKGLAVPAGTYTLRYEMQPNDGDHLGTAPTRDFLLATPAAADPDPAATFDFQALVAHSRQTSHSAHPAPFNLVAAGGKPAPGVSDDGEGHVILTTRIKTDKGELPLALVVKGVASQ